MTRTAKPTRSQPTSAQASGQALLWGVALGLFVGCGRQPEVTAHIDPPPQRPLRTMNSAIRRGQWQEAWKLSDAVLATHGDDAEAIAAVARVAHENSKPDVAAELLVRASRAESFQNASRVQQAMIAMIGVGRFYEGIEMLEEAIAAQPLQHETRRWLYDFCMGSENRKAGIPHGRFLVRQRQFDLELLLALSNTERRTQDPKPLEEMTSRNPDDKRPLLGQAKNEFDTGQVDQSIKTLRSILQAHPDFLPAQAILGRALVTAGQFDELEQWASAQTDTIEEYYWYWLAIGDWSRANDQTVGAARAYWEATRRDPDVTESWSKLSIALKQLQASGVRFSDETIQGIDRRAELLNDFKTLKSRFNTTGKISRAIVVDIANTLRDLGRLWEAEAWASIMFTLPEDDAVPAKQVRDSIAAMLRADTSWQVIQGFPELQLDMTRLDRPDIGNLPGSDRVVHAPTSGDRASGDRAVNKIRLENRAAQWGINFWGRTDENLDKPGIMLHRSLGCGGGTIDFDLDGWPDLYLMAAGGTPPQRDSTPNALFRNLAGYFQDVAANSNTGDTGFGQGVAVGDVNEDGFPDLLLLNFGPNVLLINNGDGSFTEVSQKLCNNGNQWSTSAAVADLDADGLSDMVILNYCAGLELITTPCPSSNSEIVPACSPMVFAAQADMFVQGTAQGEFVDRTQRWNANPTVTGRGMGIVAGSFDDSPGIDVFIANDMTNNHLWSESSMNDEFQLSESAMLRGLGCDDSAVAQGSMGIATGDFDRDGKTDFYVTNFNGEYNTYHQQRAAGIWLDQTAKLQLSKSTMWLVGFGTEAIDLDNDGSSELVVTNGHVDIFPRKKNPDFGERTVYAQPMQIFRRSESGRFDSIAELLAGEYLAKEHVGRALWTLDANRDGRTDFAVTHQTEPVALLVNESDDSGDWLSLRLVGRTCSRDAIGATVEVTMGDHSWMGPLTSGDGYLCSNERILRFGLGQAKGQTCDLRISWPNGQNQIHRGLEPNVPWLVIQGDEEAFAESASR